MFKRIDESQAEIDGYSYAGKGGIESVTIPEGNYNMGQFVTIRDSEGDEVCVYKQDIPNLIKALKASYNHSTEE